MSEALNSKLLPLIFGGIISVIVGIASGYGVNWLSEKKAELTYDITSIQAFPGQERVGIVAVKISNSGSKELENIDATVRFADAEVKEILFQGLTPQTTSKDKNGIRFQIPFLNAAENFSVQVLVSPTSLALQTPAVDLRAKGAVGIPLDRTTSETGGKTKELWSALVSAVATVMALVAVMIKIRTSRLSLPEAVEAVTNPVSGHEGDQRDVFAYVLGFCGLSSEANFIRSWPRNMSYWSISDILTDRWIAGADDATIRLGISALEQVIEYAQIATSSARIIQLNIARLFIALKENTSASQYLALASLVDDKVISKRVSFDPALINLSQTSP